MAISYVGWALVAMVSYSFVFLFAKLAMGDGALPPFTVMTISVAIVAVVSVVVTVLSGEWGIDSYLGTHAVYTYLAGIALTLAVVGYFRALSEGPASVVVPIYGMFIIGGAVLGIVFLDEPLTGRKVLGVGFAAASVYLIAA